jgi:probable F420-dependent oxidoreductase
MKPGIMLPGAATFSEARELARQAEAAGADAVWVTDLRRDPYLSSAAALDGTRRVQVGPNVAVAFARSPAVTAAAAWDLALLSGGRFVLGLGSQVGPTLERRFGVSVDHPGPRMRDYVRAVRACWEAYRNGHGSYEGEFYKIVRPVFQAGAEEGHEIPILVAGVNPVMTRIAGEVADGFAGHAFSTPEYMRQVLLPALEEGAARAGRRRPEVFLYLACAPDRATAAAVMFQYAVPAYRRVLDYADKGEVADRIFALSGEGKRPEARKLIETELLGDLGVIVGDDLEAGLERWRGLADRFCLGVPWYGMDPAGQLDYCRRLISLLGAIR